MEFDLNLMSGEYFLYCGMADISTESRVELDQRWQQQKISIINIKTQAEGFVFSPASILIH
jgi:hypothetical protein